ncbi:diguanylate cyclase/phosphodiesterase (GGDEF & EAL domains) with PAS/PAC sensor(s) [hydrothermal vent metagenome]|uniref:histidine kinase n=1 Tax=hydrothermal vent metagenome TaxID=652676 RepID=A0A3B1AUK2_9ZZZZ
MIFQTELPTLPAILNSLDEGILVVDNAIKITLYNPQFTKMWGIPSSLMQECDDEKTLSFIFEQLVDPANFIKKVRDLYSSLEEDRDLIRFKDGRVFERHSAPLNTTDSETYSRIWSFKDVTDKVNADLEIKVYKNYIEKLVEVRTENLERANSRLEAFNYSASHDLRAPLRSIEGFSAILLEDYQDKIDERGSKYLQTIHESVQHMRLLIENLLKLSQVTHAKLSCQQVDLTEIANKVIKQLKADALERRLKIDISAGMHAFANAELLSIALENLIGNAWKYTATQNETYIKIDSYIDEGETVFFIKDNGVGFNMDVAHELFKPFKRLHSEHEFSGSGVGLATVQRIILQHNGKIWAEAEPNNGATFYFTLAVPHSRRITH